MNLRLDDLIDSNEIAEILGLNNSRSVSTYRTRYDDFPEPVLVKGNGKCLLWLRSDITAWIDSRG